MYDICIIGAGLTGSFIAHALSKYEGNILVIDKESDIANATSMANSAIVHTGYDPEDGTLKAQLNVEGARLYPDICKRLKVDYKRCGSLVVGDDNQLSQLENLYKKAMTRGIKANLLTKDQLHEMEENIHDSMCHALFIPDTAVIYHWQVCIALMEEAIINGVDLHLGEEVQAIAHEDDFIIHTNKGVYNAKLVVNAAGCGCEQIASMIEIPPFHITPKKGEYFVLSKSANFVNHVVFPIPNEKGKGVLAVPTTHGNVLLGPTSDPCLMDDTATTQHGLDAIRDNLAKILKNVPYQELIRSYSGLRPTGNSGDFYINASKTYKNFIHVACIDSPGLASAPAIAKYMMQEFILPILKMKIKENYQPRTAPIIMSELTYAERNKIIEDYPDYGKIICRCEGISLGEIKDAIHGPCGARSIKGVKKRVRPGMGKCQGGFCEPLVAKILAEELHIPLHDVQFDQMNTNLGVKSKGEHQ